MLNLILLQAAPAGQNAAGGGWQFWIMMILIFVVFYFFMIRPQQKRQKEIRKFREGLKTGDKVITAGGIYGKIRNVNDTTFQIEIAEGVKIIIDKGSVYPSAADAAQEANNEIQK